MMCAKFLKPTAGQRHGRLYRFGEWVFEGTLGFYARTLDCWEASLVAAKERTRAIVPYETYENYVRYLRQSAHYFRTRHSDVVQFTMERR